MTVDESALWLSQEYKGDLVASLSSTLPNSGSDGKICWYTCVRDHNYHNLMYFNTTLAWSSINGWGRDGHTLIDSTFLISNFDWDFHQVAHYANNRFFFEMWNHNRVGTELGFVDGNGRYGGSAWNNWYVALHVSLILSLSGLLFWKNLHSARHTVTAAMLLVI